MSIHFDAAEVKSFVYIECANPIKTFQKEFDLENSAVLHLNFPYLLGEEVYILVLLLCGRGHLLGHSTPAVAV